MENSKDLRKVLVFESEDIYYPLKKTSNVSDFGKKVKIKLFLFI